MQKWILPPACLDHCLHRILSSYWLAHFYLMKKSAKVMLAGCWNSLLTSRNPKNNWCLSRIFGAWFGGKDRSSSTCKPWSKQAGSWINLCMKRLRTLNSYQIFNIKNKKFKNKKPIAVDVLFNAYPMVPLSCRSNQAGWYLYIILKMLSWHNLHMVPWL